MTSEWIIINPFNNTITNELMDEAMVDYTIKGMIIISDNKISSNSETIYSHPSIIAIISTT